MRVVLHNRSSTIAEATGDTIRRALNNLADQPGMTRKVEDDEWDRLLIEFEPDFYETGVEE